MPTLYQILKDKLAGKPQKHEPNVPQIYNPIGAKVGNSVTIDDIDYRGNNFFVQEIRENCVNMNGQEFKFSDYVLQANPLEGDPITVRLRIAPTEKGTFGLPFRALVMSMYYESEYDEGLVNAAKDPTKKFIVDDGPQVHEEYWRVNDVGISYTDKLTVLPVANSVVEYWDFSRMTKQDNVEFEQFLFVEMNKDNGWLQIWKGREINPEQVMVV